MISILNAGLNDDRSCQVRIFSLSDQQGEMKILILFINNSQMIRFQE